MPAAGGVRSQLAEYRRKRNFEKTQEPSGDAPPPETRTSKLRFVIQKHAASHLHFDWRLEVSGVMKSWAVPKGPSLDPSVKRLAMQVEDHPVDYNTFEGTIPQGQYGGGTVMLWDHGTYFADDATDGDDEAVMRKGLHSGKLSFTLQGERLKGSFALVRTRGNDEKPQWLLIKHRDDFADPERDIVAEVTTSVTTGRTMEEIAGGKSRVWQSNRAPKGEANLTPRKMAAKAKAAPSRATAAKSVRNRAVSLASLEPMLASVGSAIPAGDNWTFEPKFDGIRVLAFATDSAVKLVTRNGNDKTQQFPEVAAALRALAVKVKHSLVLDGELVALIGGEPARFQELQGRMHVKEESAIAGHSKDSPTGFMIFDLLLDGDDILVHEPWSERRKRLEQRLRNRTTPVIRLAESIVGDGKELLARAHKEGWEGIIAKRIDAPYEGGVRSKHWLKLKIEHRQEFVIGGYTEPRNTREHIGALLLGYFDGTRFIYVGHTGGGFTRSGLQEMYRRLKPLEQAKSPFTETPKTNERAHWVKPTIVVEVKFNEWTADGKLRQPIYLGVRDDKPARAVKREHDSLQRKPSGGKRASARAVTKRPAKKRAGSTPEKKPSAGSGSVVKQLQEIENAGGTGVVKLGAGQTLELSNLSKVYFPGDNFTKGDLMRYYASVSPFLLPAVKDRPLVLKRFPGGIDGKSFYQQKAPDDAPPAVRVETIQNEQGEDQQRLIGGDLPTLLYLVQLGSISVDPWHGRVGALEYADYSIIDLDPGPRAPFKRVVEVALRVKEELDALGLTAVPKTSGSSGIHIALPLPPKTPEAAALLVAQIVATRVAEKYPREATIERSVRSRPPAAVYVDFLQNIRAKTIASVYSVRAKAGATVSTPLRWSELDASLDRQDFTLETVPDRLARVGDLWAAGMKKPNSLKAVVATARNR
jgi:bifunctional non-homologous end joining protein LigD